MHWHSSVTTRLPTLMGKIKKRGYTSGYSLKLIPKGMSHTCSPCHVALQSWQNLPRGVAVFSSTLHTSMSNICMPFIECPQVAAAENFMTSCSSCSLSPEVMQATHDRKHFLHVALEVVVPVRVFCNSTSASGLTAAHDYHTGSCWKTWPVGVFCNALFNPEASIFIQKRHPYTGNLNPKTSGDSKNTFLHCANVLGPSASRKS